MGIFYKAYCRSYQTVFRAATYLLNWKKPELISGEDSVLKIPEILKKHSFNNVMLVSGKTITKLGLPDKLLSALDNNGIECHIFCNLQPNPTIKNVEDAKDFYIKNNCQAIIALGGGSPMDCAKIAGARVANPNTPVSKMRGQLKIRKPVPFLIAIPTTAGTGSETTIAAVVTDSDTHEKFAVNDLKLMPKYAVLDPTLTVGLPAHITAATGMDALTHAVEAFIGRSYTKETSLCARKAVKLIFENLEKAYVDGSDIVARNNMLKASYYAGVAFTRAYVGYVHAIAHQLGGMYGVSHGLANAVILPHILEYFAESAKNELASLAECIGVADKNKTSAENAYVFINSVKNLNITLGIPNSFDCIREEDIPVIVKRALKEGNPLYPVPKIMDADDCTDIVEKLMNCNQ